MIDVRGHDLPIDVLEELEPYEWGKVRLTGNEMNACSPFRNEKRPSFRINTETGLWIDHGAGINDSFKKGNLLLLLSFFRNETPEEIEDYLLDKYGVDLSDVESLSLGLDFTEERETPFIMPLNEYEQYAYRHPYLSGRGVSDRVQRSFKIGYDPVKKAVAIPWFDVKGNIVNVKFRSVNSKMFFYLPNGQRLNSHIYGMYFVYKLRCQKVYLVESEIDALFLWSNGYPAIALGGSNISEKQRLLLIRSPIRELVLATDNDSQGAKLRSKCVQIVNGLVELKEITLPGDAKDVNDLSQKILPSVLENTIQVPLFANLEHLK